jgi:hypothetical protein
MTKFTVHTAETAPAASRPLLEGIGRSFGFVPNLFGVFAESPDRRLVPLHTHRVAT